MSPDKVNSPSAGRHSPIKRDILVRVRWLYVLFIVMGAAIFVKILYTQYGPEGAELRKRANEVVYNRVTVPAQRGDVLSRDGRTLATTIPMFDLRVDFAAEVIDTTMKNMARAELRAAARERIKAADGNKRIIKGINEQLKIDLRNHAALNARAREIYNAKADTLAHGLAALFTDRPAASYRRMLDQARENRRRNRNVRINPRRMNFSELKEVMRLPILSIKRLDNKGKTVLLHIPVRGCTKIEEIQLREHPFGSLALRTIGVAREDSVVQVINGERRMVPAPKLGVEGAFDQYLRGQDGNTLMQSISGIATVPVQDPDNREPVHGIDVVTTLDVELQDIAERALRNQLENLKAEWGTVILMEVATGEIHAMSNLTRYRDGRIVDDLNYGIGRNMEPGSTFKLATLMTLLDDAGISLDDVVNTGGKTAVIGRAIVTDDHPENHPITLRRVFEVSSNIGFSKLVHEKYGADPARFVDHVCKIGLDKPLHVQIPGSLAPVIRRPGDTYWTKGLTLEKMAYGYSFEITPMRTLCLYNAVANGGRMLSPLLVKELRQYGDPVRTFKSETIVESVCTPRTLALVREGLEKVVEEGTAIGLSNKNYQVAAKTGTAQVAFTRRETAGGRGGYVDIHGGRRYVASMVGYFPADKPKYSCIVVMQTYFGQGNYNTYYGASLSGPVFKAVADRVFSSQISWHESVAEGREPLREPVPLKGGRPEDSRKVASKLDLPLDAPRGMKGWAIAQPDSATMHLVSIDVTPAKVPQVVGMGLKEAIYLLESSGLRAAFSGRGVVVSQSLAPGTSAQRGTAVYLRLD
jgi:cell division protein FtsI (penicillin-binding protein 3)